VTAFRSINLVALLLCFCVVVFGAYVRLADAGLGCPDWPGCYGHLGVPEEHHEVTAAEEKFPQRPVEAHKAWKEMIHRYLASTLGLLIVAMALISVFNKRDAQLPRRLPWFLVALVIFQGMLGMWTVTWQLKPLVVTGHLFGGLSTLSLLLWMWLSVRNARAAPPADDKPLRELRSEREAAFAFAASTTSPAQTTSSILGGLRVAAAGALVVLACQIFLGGWTSTNYAALACPDFPTCHGQWLPETDVQEAFVLWRGLGINYEYGVLDNRARVTIHFFHRIGAIVTTVVLGLLAIVMLRSRSLPVRRFGIVVICALALQIVIGISTVKLQLPLLLAAAHNAGAALLVITLVSLNHFLWTQKKKEIVS
jgi:cytochrome c oxidase assembly protein subunit 15